jgi:hypothetical protein
MLIDASCRVVQVTGAFFGSDFVTVSKTEDYNWAVLKPDIFAAIMDHFASGEPLFTDASAAASDTAINDDDTEVPIRCSDAGTCGKHLPFAATTPFACGNSSARQR